jgi:hypothetical protein
MPSNLESEAMTDDLLAARESFYRRFVVIGAAAVGHLLIMLICLALTLVGKAIFAAAAVFVLGHGLLTAAFHAAWTRLKEQYPDTVPAAEAEAGGELEATPPYEQRRTSAVRSFRKREAAPA